MSEIRDESGSNVLTTEDQIAERDTFAFRYIKDLIAHLNAGDLDAAEHSLRRHAYAELVTNAASLHFALTKVGSEVPLGDLTTPRHPALLLAVAFARNEATANLQALVPILRQAATTLRKERGASPADRARDLSLATLCHLLADQPADAAQTARRAAELVSGFTFVTESDDATLMGTSASDLALAFFLLDRVWDAARMWQWVRTWTADPRLPRLMQADWGTSVVGMIVGDRSMVSPLASELLDRPRSVGGENYPPRDPWWAIISTARAWSQLDMGNPEAALEITQATLMASRGSVALGPLAFVHGIALLACGRPTQALEFVDGQLQQDPTSGEHPEYAWRAGVAMVSAAYIGEADVQQRYEKLAAQDPAVYHLLKAFALLAAGDLQGAALALVVPSHDEAPRLIALYWTLFSAVHSALGHRSMAVIGLRRLASLIESNKTRVWLHLLPQRELDDLRTLARDEALDYVLPYLPERSVATASRVIDLTDRETEILLLVAQGLTNAQIAANLYILPNTVKFHVAKLLRRLGVATREDAANTMTARKHVQSIRGTG